MPRYDFQCECGHVQEEVLRVAQLDTSAPACEDCGGKMRQVLLEAPMAYVRPDTHYKCPVTNAGVTSQAQRRNIMAKHDLIDANDFTPEYAMRKEKKKWDDIRKRAKAHDDFINTALPGVTLNQVVEPTL